MSRDSKTLSQELSAVWATVIVCRQLQTRKAKGEHLVDRLADDPITTYWFKLTLRGDYQLPPPSILGHLEYFGKPSQPTMPLRKLITTYNSGNESFELPQFAKHLAAHARELGVQELETLKLIFSRDLQCGVDTALLNKVLVKLEQEPVPLLPAQPPKLADFQLIITTDGQFGHNGVLLCSSEPPGDDKSANISFETNHATRKFLQCLREGGATVSIPTYAMGLRES